jgi:hypothetical protein
VLGIKPGPCTQEESALSLVIAPAQSNGKYFKAHFRKQHTHYSCGEDHEFSLTRQMRKTPDAMCANEYLCVAIKPQH